MSDQGPTHGAGRPPVDASAAATPPTPPPGPPGGYGYGYPPAPPPKQHGVLHKIAISLVTTVFLFSIGLNIYFAIIFAAQLETSQVQEQVWQAGETDDRVAILPIVGMIDGNQAEFVRLALDELDAEPPAALVIRVESGGGTIAGSDQIYHRIEQFKADHPNVPVVASFGIVAASGGYYVAMPASHIYAEKTTITGSIGVIANYPNISELLDKIGVDMHVIVAESSRDKEIANNLFEPWEEGDENYQSILRLLNVAHEQFRDVVRKGRPNLTQHLQTLAAQPGAATQPDGEPLNFENVTDGDIFYGPRAVELGLVDEEGYLSDAIAKAASLAGLPPGEKPHAVIIQPRVGLLGALLGASADGRGVSSVSLADLDSDKVRAILDDAARVRIEYRAPHPLP